MKNKKNKKIQKKGNLLLGHVNIKGQPYTLYLVDNEDLNYTGLTNTFSHDIFLNIGTIKNVNSFSEHMSNTISHELFHAYFHECGLDVYCKDETLVDNLAFNVFSLQKSFEQIADMVNKKVR